MGAYSTVEVLAKVIGVFERSLNVMSKEEVEAKRTKGEYPYVAYHIEDFLKQVQAADLILAAHGVKVRSFIDVGCGVGTKLFAAYHTLENWNGTPVGVTGIEITPKYVDVAQNLLDTQKDEFYRRDYGFKDKIQVLQADGRDYDYKDHNIIYFYCPMLEPTLQRVLEKRIMKTAPKGAVILGNLIQTRAHEWEKAGFQAIRANASRNVIFRKVKR